MRYQPIVNLAPHQRLACDFIKSVPYCGLFLEMGFGKTVTTLEALYELDEPGHVLVIGPKPVVRSTWIDEINKFGFPFRLNSLIIDENGHARKPSDRHQLYHDLANMAPALWLINREMVSDLVDNLPRQGKAIIWPFTTVILDEAQSFKSYKSKRHKALMKARPAIHRLIELSGTPTPNGLEDLWSLVHLLDGGARLGQNITAYRNRWFKPGYIKNPVTGYPVDWQPLPGAENQIYDAVADICISMRNVNQLMPQVTINDVIVQISDSERDLYNELLKESILTFDDGDEAIASNAAVLQAKLLQMASGTLYVNESTDKWQVIHDRKLEMLTSIVEQTGTPVLVPYYFRNDKKRILEHLKAQSIDVQAFDGTPKMVNDWNAGTIRVMLVQPASAGHGLNLQIGPGHTIVWYTLPWNLEHYLQTNARIARQGQQNPVMIHRLITEDTVDEAVATALVAKDLSMKRFFDAVDAMRQRLTHHS